MKVYVTAQELHELLDGPRDVVLLDVRWRLTDGEYEGRERYLEGHIPGAVSVDLTTELSGPPSAEQGRHPLPDISVLEVTARRWGVTARSIVVAYDEPDGNAAARAWWLLKWGGVEDVYLLHGGLAAWEAAGYELQREPMHPGGGDVVLRPGNLTVLDADRAEDFASSAILIDVRAPARYLGEEEPVDPRAGHIPGAVNWPVADVLAAAQPLNAAEARARLAELSPVSPAEGVGVYCGSGITASATVAALQSVGIDAALYSGSWSQWSADSSRPVAIGE